MKYFILFLALLPLHSYAAETGIDRYSQEQQGQIERALSFLNNITTMQATFTQESPDGSSASGELTIQRPGGRMRWDYHPPTPIWMLSTGEFLIYVDTQLEQVSYIPIGDTLAAFLARDKIALGGEIELVDFREGAGKMVLVIRQREKPENGLLTLEMDSEKLALNAFILTDQLGQMTRVAFTDVTYGAPIPEGKLEFVDPSREWDKKKRNR